MLRAAAAVVLVAAALGCAPAPGEPPAGASQASPVSAASPSSPPSGAASLPPAESPATALSPEAPLPLTLRRAVAVEPEAQLTLSPGVEIVVDPGARFELELGVRAADARLALLDAHDALVAATGTREVGATTLLTLTPAAPLTPGSRYTVRLDGAATRELHDHAGRAYAPVLFPVLAAGTPPPPEPKKPAKKPKRSRRR